MKIFCCICKKELERKPCLIKRVKHNVCSYKCRNLLYSKIYTKHNNYQPNTSCDGCGKKIYKENKELHRTKHNFCSASCYGKCMGALHWKGGKKAALVRTQSKRREFGFELLNEPFENCEGHHEQWADEDFSFPWMDCISTINFSNPHFRKELGAVL